MLLAVMQEQYAQHWQQQAQLYSAGCSASIKPVNASRKAVTYMCGWASSIEVPCKAQTRQASWRIYIHPDMSTSRHCSMCGEVHEEAQGGYKIIDRITAALTPCTVPLLLASGSGDLAGVDAVDACRRPVRFTATKALLLLMLPSLLDT